jgi:glyoxylase-like metal-dependent hydrolase (beta-lactamase superfamily II)
MANAQEAALQYPMGETLPPPGRAIDVAPGVRWLRMGLPFALDHINLWLLRDEAHGPQGLRSGWTIVDCGIANDPTREAWEQIFAHELDGEPVLRVIVTHMHPDHIGLAHWLCERWGGDGIGDAATRPSPLAEQRSVEAAGMGAHPPLPACRLWISGTDWNAARMASRATTGFGGEGAARFFARHGLTDPEAQAKVRARTNYYASMVPAVPERYRRLMDGMPLAVGRGDDRHDWRCIAGYGHAPEHIALYSERLGVLIAGDMVLPRISTNVSVIDLEPEADPLPLYLSSIERLRSLPADTLVLPSHGRPFVGLHTRIDQLQAHHAARLDEVLTACAEAPRSAAELLPVLFKRPLDLHQTTFAMGEAIAHVHMLAGGGRLRAQPEADGVLRWACT